MMNRISYRVRTTICLNRAVVVVPPLIHFLSHLLDRRQEIGMASPRWRTYGEEATFGVLFDEGWATVVSSAEDSKSLTTDVRDESVR